LSPLAKGKSPTAFYRKTQIMCLVTAALAGQEQFSLASLDAERAMSTMNLDMTTVRRRRVLRRAVMIGSAAATAVVIGLLTAQSFFHTATASNAGANPSLIQPVAAPAAVTFEIVPSPVIETNGQFFFGTGDGSAGYYSERPVQ
jgi:hypothetical protein